MENALRKAPVGLEGYGKFEHLYGAKYETEADAIAAAESAIKNN